MAGSWPLSHLKEKGCYFEVVAVVMKASGVAVEISTVEAEVDPVVAVVFEVVTQLLRHRQSLDSNVFSTSDTFPRPPYYVEKYS